LKLFFLRKCFFKLLEKFDLLQKNHFKAFFKNNLFLTAASCP
jgi:hypothetical protein